MHSYAVTPWALAATLSIVTGLVPAQSEVELERALEQLGSESPAARAGARKAILDMGATGVDALRRACAAASDVPPEMLFVIAEDLGRERRTVTFKQVWDLAERGWRLEWRGDQLALLQKLGGTVRFFDAQWQPTGLTFGKNAAYFALAPNGNGFAFNEGKGQVVIDHGDGKRVEITAQNRPSVAYSPDGSLLAIGEYANRIDLWRVADGARVNQLAIAGTRGGLTPVFSPNGKLLVVGNRNDKTHIFDVDSGKILHVLARKQTQQPVFSPDGKLLAIAYVDAKIGIWNVTTGKLAKLLDSDAAEVFTLAWSADGRFLASAGLNGPIVIWSGKHLARLQALDGGSERTFRLGFRADGKVLAATGNRTTRAWTIAVR